MKHLLFISLHFVVGYVGFELYEQTNDPFAYFPLGITTIIHTGVTAIDYYWHRKK